ncbi:MAG: hypothetical protein F6K48_14030 [Okeania sp. SIO3H1]|nr:hypothetical protein [Okeania sp. SIO1I7]NEN89964.1 hypothetical protein [Okeania sp. SIO3H1]NET29503.1 hypothetical protein [Okeania sp. SIO1I7]
MEAIAHTFQSYPLDKLSVIAIANILSPYFLNESLVVTIGNIFTSCL